MGDFEVYLLGYMESPVKYHPFYMPRLTCGGKTAQEQYLAGSFSGALSSQNVTEEFKGTLGADGNRAGSVMA